MFLGGFGKQKRTLVCVAVPPCTFAMSPCTSTLSFACAPIGRRFGNPCEHGCAHLVPIVPPPGGNPSSVVLCVRSRGRAAVAPACRLALGFRVKPGMTAVEGTRVRERATAPPCAFFCTVAHPFYHVIPAFERESWAVLCGVLLQHANHLACCPSSHLPPKAPCRNTG